jgi:alpha-2-macroglobulin-like protein
MNPNDHILEYADAYLHDVLSPGEKRAVERHVKTCRICQTALEEAQKRYDALHAVPPVEAPERLVQETIHRLENYREPLKLKMKRWTIAGGAAAAIAAVVLIAAVHAYFYTLTPPTYDLRILGQSELLAGAPASLRVGVYDAQRDRFVPGVPVQLAMYKPGGTDRVDLAQFTTGEAAAERTSFELPDWPEGRYELRVSASLPDGGTDELLRTVTLKRSWRLMLTSDKPVYQPGQTIHLRALALRKPDLKPVAGQEAVFTLTDPKGNILFKQADPTGRFGIASADCPLAAEVMEGDYQIDCRIGDTASRRTVKIERYALPKFKLEATLDRPYYLPGETVQGEVQADYFFGKPVAGAGLTIHAAAPDIGWREIAVLEATTDETGRANFRFTLPTSLTGRPQEEGAALLRIIIEATDTAGQRHTLAVSRRVAAQPILIDIIPESPTLLRGKPNRVYFFTRYPDGSPASTRLAITGIDEEVETNALGAAVVEIAPDTEIGLTVRATDDEGRVGRKHARLGAAGGADDFLLRPNRAVYRGGETVELIALGSGGDPVFLDVLKDGQTLVTTTIAMNDGRGEAAIDLPPEAFGALRLVAYRFNTDGVSVRQERAIYVERPSDLEVGFTADKDVYRPGETAELRFTLRNKDGRPAPGALSLAAVDEAVFSVLTGDGPLSETFFTLDEELLRPMATVYNWDPNPRRRLAGEVDLSDLQLLEEAVFAATARKVRIGDVHRTFSLFDRSYPEKLASFVSRREAGLDVAKMLWILWAASAVVVAAVVLTIRYPIPMLILYGVVGLPMLCVLFLPAIQSAREAAVATGAAAMDAESAPPPDFMAPGEESGAAGPPRVREHFPETLLWRPELITDENGEATLSLELADSITAWRLTAGAVTAEGALGGGEWPIRVFQPFFVDLNLPPALTRGDEVQAPIVVYNYLDEPQTVKLTLKDADWFERILMRRRPVDRRA